MSVCEISLAGEPKIAKAKFWKSLLAKLPKQHAELRPRILAFIQQTDLVMIARRKAETTRMATKRAKRYQMTGGQLAKFKAVEEIAFSSPKSANAKARGVLKYEAKTLRPAARDQWERVRIVSSSMAASNHMSGGGGGRFAAMKRYRPYSDKVKADMDRALWLLDKHSSSYSKTETLQLAVASRMLYLYFECDYLEYAPGHIAALKKKPRASCEPRISRR